MQEPLASEVGSLGVGPVAQDIINVSYAPSYHLSSFALELISELQ
jgi:hypothetical protein